MSHRKTAPPGCYWRGPPGREILWARIEVAGQRYRWSLRTRNAAIAASRRERRRLELIGAAHFGEVRHTYRDAAIAWSTAIAAEVAAATAKRYAVSLGQLAPFLLPLYLDQVDKARIGEIVAARQAHGASNATIKRDLTALSSVMGYAEDQGWRPDNPVLTWLRPSQRRRSRLRERRDPIELPAIADVERMIARAPGLFGTLIAAARATGCRQAELTSARRSDLDLDRRQLTVRGKGNKSRTIDLEPFGGFAMLAGLPAYLGSPWLFWHGDGEPFRNVSSRFAAMTAALARNSQNNAPAGTPATRSRGGVFRRFRFHHLRHLHAVEWLKAGRSIYDLQKRLGHASIKTTEIYLAFLTPDEARQAMAGRAAG